MQRNWILSLAMTLSLCAHAMSYVVLAPNLVSAPTLFGKHGGSGEGGSELRTDKSMGLLVKSVVKLGGTSQQKLAVYPNSTLTNQSRRMSPSSAKSSMLGMSADTVSELTPGMPNAPRGVAVADEATELYFGQQSLDQVTLIDNNFLIDEDALESINTASIQGLVLHIYVNERGSVDRIDLPADKTIDANVSLVLRAFEQAKFTPGGIAGKAVKTVYVVELADSGGGKPELTELILSDSVVIH